MEWRDLQKPQTANGFLHGKLLIAMPGMTDSRFERSVIFMCSHNEQGALGLIVNKPLGLPFRELMNQMNITTTSSTSKRPVLFGGPVDTDRGYVLHGSERSNRASTLTITPDVFLTPTVDILRAIAEGRGPERWLMALGYAGWGPGQVESEIAANGWIHCDADIELVFGREMESKWARAFAKLGAGLSGLSWQTGRA
ncbi:MAG: YqgE/AlgH family protein [Alphaproteobacteria bacterium]|nr:YqgE/AlgH family protein [Alphaproteobacteria bacterium]MBV9419609.1 YqgE/AlgH family protein [Alphaproteobacteria bacterium]MBV9541748.1 YqgE/AlgH family protein [Alphaproteobacteria bacterium]